MHTLTCRSLVSLTILAVVGLPAIALAAESTADAFIKTVSALPAEQQVGAVIIKLKELNPNFDGKETHKIENGVVTTLSFSSVGVTDISPVKALRWLRTLSITPPALNQKGTLESLAPLQGMQLTWLWCHNNPITDLSPLKGMPLTVLSISGTQVSDLSPLTGMKLQVLSFNDTVVNDIAPLEGMPLTVLWCNNTKVTDLTPLKAIPLQELRCDQAVAAQNAAALRGIRTLAKINDQQAAAFWMRVGPATASNVGGTSASRPTTTTPQESRGTEAVPTLARGPEKTMTTSTGIELVWVPPGEFLMGSTAKERLWAVGPEGNQDPAYRFESGEPKRTIIKNGFWMARTEVTVGQWQKFVDAGYVTEAEKHGSATAPDLKTGKMGTVQGASWRNPNFGFPPKENHPVCCISWNDAVAFCQWLTEAEKKAGKLPTGLVYRLPSEAEWEYACRGGKEGTKFWWGNTMDQGKGRLNASGVIWGDSYKYASPVDAFGSRGRNGFGLADMLGNVYEWCLDDFDPETAHAEPYKGKTTDRVLRGGSWYEFRPSNLRCAHRFRWPSSYANAKGGFRVCAGVAW